MILFCDFIVNVIADTFSPLKGIFDIKNHFPFYYLYMVDLKTALTDLYLLFDCFEWEIG